MKDYFRKYGIWIGIIVVLAAILIVTPSIRGRKGAAKAESSTETETQEETATLLCVNNYEELYEMLTRSRNEKEQTKDGTMEITVEDMPVVDSSGSIASNETAAETSEDYSQTNTREDSVDEGDIVKTDGEYIYVLDQTGNVHIVDAKEMELAGTILFDGKEQSRRMEMYVDGEILQVIWQEQEYLSVEGEISTEQGQTRTYYSIPVSVTVLATYDISDRTDPVKKGVYRQDGSYLSSRKNEGYLYLFTSYTPGETKNADIREGYVPRTGEDFFACEEIHFPGNSRQGAFGGSSYLVSASVSDDAPDTAKDRAAVVSGGEMFYVSEENIYAAVSMWMDDSDVTELVRIGYEEGNFEAGSSGRVPGILNDSFSMDEYDGCLRLVTTCDTAVEKKNLFTTEVSYTRTNRLYVLNGYLEILGKIEDLAEGEEIQSARFMGDTGYFVTYRNVDPLFCVDLSDPEAPKVLGELKLTGFSEYLHFYGEDRLLGIGWETDPETGEQLGLKCTMFDISDPRNVQATDQLIVEGVDYCEALNAYKSILVDTEKNIFGFAYMMYEEESWEEQYFYGVFTYEEETGFLPLQYILTGEEMVSGYEDYKNLRGIYIGDTFYLAGNYGVIFYAMDEDFEKTASVFW